MSLKETSRSSGQLLVTSCFPYWRFLILCCCGCFFNLLFLGFPFTLLPSSTPFSTCPFFLWAHEWPLGSKVTGWASKILLLRPAAMASPASYWQCRISLTTVHTTAEPKCRWTRSNLEITALKCRHRHTHIGQIESPAKSQRKLNCCELIINLFYYSHHLILSFLVLCWLVCLVPL